MRLRCALALRLSLTRRPQLPRSVANTTGPPLPWGAARPTAATGPTTSCSPTEGGTDQTSPPGRPNRSSCC
eukprot:1745918-Lingulodinium_polyedra.AAC.1